MSTAADPRIGTQDGPPHATGRDTARWIEPATWILVGLGVALRVVQYASNRSLWIDEARLALNLLDRPIATLATPLADSQAAPIGFLFLVKLLSEVFGGSEYALRLLPFLASLLSLFLFRSLARRIAEGWAVPLAVGILAISPHIVWHSSEVKPYTTDMAAAMALLLMALHLHARRVTAPHILLAAAAGCLAVWLSFPAAFVLAGIGTTLMVVAWRAGDSRRAAIFAGVAALWLASFALSIVPLRGITSGTYLQQYWSGAFMPLPPRSVGDLEWFLFAFLELFRNPVGLENAGLAAFAFFAGCVALRPRPLALPLLLAPILFALVASAAELYPFSERLLLFAAPSLILVLAAGAAFVISRLRGASRALAVAFALLLILQPAINILARIPMEKEEIRPLVEHARANWRDGDFLYLYYGAEPAYRYYTRGGDFTGGRAAVSPEARADWDAYLDDIARLESTGRTWVLFSHVHTGTGANEELLFTTVLDRTGQQVDRIAARGASLYLYDLRPADAAPVAR